MKILEITALCTSVVIAATACGSSPPPHVKEKKIEAPVEGPSTVTTVKEPAKPDAFRATSGPGDAAVAFVRDERSSRLDLPMPPRGRTVKEDWRVPLEAKLKPCRGLCPATQAAFVLAAGNRVAVVGGEQWIVYDTAGRKAEAGKIENGGGAMMRLDRASGAIVPDETRSADLPEDAKVAAHKGLVVMVKNGGVHVGERAIEGKFDAFDVAIDDRERSACVIVRQGDDLLLWNVPLAASGGIGRQRIPDSKNRRPLAPPLLGKNLRVLLLDTGFVALTLDGKRAWERRGVPTGGASITSDDHVVIADNGKIIDIDPKGKATELFDAKDVVFTTPPILNAQGILFVASGEMLHALSFS